VVVFAWAHAQSSGEVVDREGVEALALLFRAWRRLLERLPSLGL
jgi:hypothetical protein